MQCRRPGFDPWVRKIPLEKGISIHSIILAWRIPWTEEPGRLQSLRSQRVATNTFTSLLLREGVLVGASWEQTRCQEMLSLRCA